MLNVSLVVSTHKFELPYYEKFSESAAAVVADFKLLNTQMRILSFRCGFNLKLNAFLKWIAVLNGHFKWLGHAAPASSN